MRLRIGSSLRLREKREEREERGMRGAKERTVIEQVTGK